MNSPTAVAVAPVTTSSTRKLQSLLSKLIRPIDIVFPVRAHTDGYDHSSAAHTEVYFFCQSITFSNHEFYDDRLRIMTSRSGRAVAPAVPWVAAVLGVVLTLPSLGAGLIADDYLQRVVLQGSEVVPTFGGPWWGLFTFVPGTEEGNRALIEAGVLPTWTPDLITFQSHNVEQNPNAPGLLNQRVERTRKGVVMNWMALTPLMIWIATTPVEPATTPSEFKPGTLSSVVHPGDPLQEIHVAGFETLPEALRFTENGFDVADATPKVQAVLERGDEMSFSGASFLVLYWIWEDKPELLSLTRCHADLHLLAGSCGMQLLLTLQTPPPPSSPPLLR